MTYIKAKFDLLNLPSDELDELREQNPNNFPNTKIKVSDEFISDLNDFCDDHKTHFDCLPVEFEYDGFIIEYDDFLPLLNKLN